MKPLGTRMKAVLAFGCIGMLIIFGVLSKTLAQSSRYGQSSVQSSNGAGRYQMITVNSLESDNGLPFMPSRANGDAVVPTPVRNYDKVMMVDTITGKAWELDPLLGWVSTGTAPNSTLMRVYHPLSNK